MCLFSLCYFRFIIPNENPLFLYTLVNICTMHVFLLFSTMKGGKEVSLHVYLLRHWNPGNQTLSGELIIEP